MKARDVQEYLQTLNGGWVDYAKSVDTFKAGDPEAELTGIAVAWMSYTAALEEAAAAGSILFITHEPTYSHHTDAEAEQLKRPEARDKRARIEALGLTILRCHDLWDQVREIGIPDSWGRRLGLGDPIEGEGYFRVYDGGGRSALEVARALAARVQDLGQPGVQLIGPEQRPVDRIVLGTGAITPYRKMVQEFRADLAVCSDDGFCYWRDGAHAIDRGNAVLVFHHHVTEDHGMELLARHLAGKFPDVPVRHIRQTCMYKLVS